MKRKLPLVQFLTGLLLMFAVPAGVFGTDTAPSADTIHIRELEIIHYVKTPAFISSGADTISMLLMSSRSLSELLVFQPALYIKSAGRGALSTASFRGTDASHTKVYWNGMSLNSPMLGQVDFSLLPVFLLDELTLLYGGSSLEEGSGALGGAVMLENSTDWNDGGNLFLSQETGSFGTWTSQARLNLGDRKLRSSTRIFSTRSENNYEFLNTDVIPTRVDKLKDAAYSVGGVLQEIYFKPGIHNEIALRLWYEESDRELPPLMSHEGSDRDENQQEEQLRSSLEWKAYTDRGKLMLRTGFAASRIHYYLYHRDLEYLQFDSRSLENSLYNTLQYEWSPGIRTGIRFRADYNMHGASIRSLRDDTGYEHEREELKLMVSGSRQLGKRATLYGLMRQERADGSWLPLMPSAGLKVDVLDRESGNLQVRTNLSRNYNLPSLNDLYWIPGGNRELRPEKSINSDLSLDFATQSGPVSWKARLNLYAAWVSDWILWKPTQFRFWEAENIAEVFSRGFDTRMTADFSAAGIRFTAMLNYAFTRSTDQGSFPASQLIYIPVHTSSAYLNLSRKGYYLNWTMSYAGKRFTLPPGIDYEESLNPYCLNDLHFGKSFAFRRLKAGMRFSVYNISNVNYQAVRSRPMPGRNYEVSLNIGM